MAQDVIKTPTPDVALGIWPDRPLLQKSDDEVTYKRIVRITKVKRPALEFFKAKNVTGEAPCVIIRSSRFSVGKHETRMF